MKAKFWSVCTITVLALLSGVYFSTAQMSDAPSVLSDSQMEQLSGTRVDWTCKRFQACTSISCNSTNLITQVGINDCYSCETQLYDNCYYSFQICYTCVWQQYASRCRGSVINTGGTQYNKCDLN